jgi:hypothetical protein
MTYPNSNFSYSSIEYLEIPGISFREYIEGMGMSFDIQELFHDPKYDLTQISKHKYLYLESGDLAEHLLHPEQTTIYFEKKITDIHQELFEKEY